MTPAALIAASVAFLAVSLFFSMFGKGGGEFYMVILTALLGLPYYVSAGVTLFVLTVQGASMLLVYWRRHRLVDWALAATTGSVALAAAFLGGLVSASMPAKVLKLTFSALLAVSAYVILRGFSLRPAGLPGPRLRRSSGGYDYCYNPLAAAAPVAVIAFLASMAGISGGSLIVPVLVILGGVPLRIAIGTNPFLVLIASASGFTAHLARGGFDPALGAALAAAALVGSQVGSRLHARLGERSLRLLFAASMLLAAAIMALRAFT